LEIANTRNQTITMFKPVRPNKISLSYSDEILGAKTEVPLRSNNPTSSFPSFRHSSADLEELDQLPILADPDPLPGDCKVKEYILENVTPYLGDSSFLKGPTERTLKAWKRCEELMEEELKRGGVLDVDTHTASTIISHAPGYVLSKDEDVIVGLQTDEALKRSCKPRGGFSVVRKALESYGYEADPQMKKTYTEVCLTCADLC
jgi:Pyruvate formate lyase-like